MNFPEPTQDNCAENDAGSYCQLKGGWLRISPPCITLVRRNVAGPLGKCAGFHWLSPGCYDSLIPAPFTVSACLPNSKARAPARLRKNLGRAPRPLGARAEKFGARAWRARRAPPAAKMARAPARLGALGRAPVLFFEARARWPRRAPRIARRAEARALAQRCPDTPRYLQTFASLWQRARRDR